MMNFQPFEIEFLKKKTATNHLQVCRSLEEVDGDAMPLLVYEREDMPGKKLYVGDVYYYRPLDICFLFTLDKPDTLAKGIQSCGFSKLKWDEGVKEYAFVDYKPIGEFLCDYNLLRGEWAGKMVYIGNVFLHKSIVSILNVFTKSHDSLKEFLARETCIQQGDVCWKNRCMRIQYPTATGEWREEWMQEMDVETLWHAANGQWNIVLDTQVYYCSPSLNDRERQRNWTTLTCTNGTLFHLHSDEVKRDILAALKVTERDWNYCTDYIEHFATFFVFFNKEKGQIEYLSVNPQLQDKGRMTIFHYLPDSSTLYKRIQPSNDNLEYANYLLEII